MDSGKIHAIEFETYSTGRCSEKLGSFTSETIKQKVCSNFSNFTTKSLFSKRRIQFDGAIFFRWEYVIDSFCLLICRLHKM